VLVYLGKFGEGTLQLFQISVNVHMLQYKHNMAQKKAIVKCFYVKCPKIEWFLLDK